MNHECVSPRKSATFKRSPAFSTRLIGAIAAAAVTLSLFEVVAEGFTASAAVQVAQAQPAKVLVASAR